MARSNSDVISRFVAGKYDGSGATNVNARERGVRLAKFPDDSFPALYSYATPIAVTFREGQTILVNPNRYSVSTSAHQSTLRSELYWRGYEETPNTMKLANEYGRHDPRREWAFIIYERQAIPAITAERRRELEVHRDTYSERARNGDAWSRTYNRQKVKEISEILEGDRIDSFYI